MTMSIASASICATNSAARAGDQMVSDVTIAVRASGKSAATSSAIRSTPGPQATRLSSSPHSGQAFGGGITWPQWWQASRRISRCSTIHAVQLGHWKRWPQWRQRVSGAKPRRLRNSSDCSPALEIGLEFGDEARRQPAAARRRVLGQVDGADLGHARSGEAVGKRHLAIAADLDHVPRLDRRRRGGEDDRNVLELAAHHRDVAGVILDAFLLLEARLVRLVDDDQAEVRDRAGTAPSERRRSPSPRRWRCPRQPRRRCDERRSRVPGDGLAAEAVLEALQEWLGQRDFGQQDERLLALPQAFRDRLEIDFGLAGARSRHRAGPGRSPCRSRPKAGRGLLLLLVQVGRRRGRDPGRGGAGRPRPRPLPARPRSPARASLRR